jgi:hypothetical protein
MWAVRLVLWAASGQMEGAWAHPWAHATALGMAAIHPNLHPMVALTAAGPSDAAGPEAPPLLIFGADLPPDMRDLVLALSHLPPVTDIAEAPLEPGQWCATAPLWGNPLLPNSPTALARGGRPGLERLHPRISLCRKVRTLGDAIRARAAWDTSPGEPSAWDAWVTANLDPSDASGFRRRTVGEALTTLLSDISPEWKDAAAAALDAAQQGAPAPTEMEVRAMLVPRLGWRRDAITVTLRKATCKILTSLQLGDVGRRRAELHAAFEREALGLPGPGAGAGVGNQGAAANIPSQVPALLRRAWEVRWERHHKETLWRLAVDGVPLLGNSHLHGTRPERCVCGEYGGQGAGPPGCSPRAHHFWECAVAKAVVGEISAALPNTPLRREHIWLGREPKKETGETAARACVWEVVVLAATSAMETARTRARADARRAAAAAAGAQVAAEAAAAVGEAAAAGAAAAATEATQAAAAAGAATAEGAAAAALPAGVTATAAAAAGARRARRAGHAAAAQAAAAGGSGQGAVAAAQAAAAGGSGQGPAAAAPAAAAAGAGAGGAEGAPPDPLAVAKAIAVADFWSRLECFAALGEPRRKDTRWEEVEEDHPFLSRSAQGVIYCRRPGGPH